MRVGLVGCVKSKARFAGPARELYTSALFRGRCAYVERTCDRWFILSAKHGLVLPEQVLEPYEESLTEKSAAARRAWAATVLDQIAKVVGIRTTTFEIHAGAAYRTSGLTSGLERRGAIVDVPVEHLGQGQQLAFYGGQWQQNGLVPTTSNGERTFGGSKGSRYAALGEHLCNTSADAVSLSLVQIERLLGAPLPASARRHRAWWANDVAGSHSQARAWLDAGWVIDSVNLNASTVHFRRDRL